MYSIHEMYYLGGKLHQNISRIVLLRLVSKSKCDFWNNIFLEEWHHSLAWLPIPLVSILLYPPNSVTYFLNGPYTKVRPVRATFRLLHLRFTTTISMLPLHLILSHHMLRKSLRVLFKAAPDFGEYKNIKLKRSVISYRLCLIDLT